MTSESDIDDYLKNPPGYEPPAEPPSYCFDPAKHESSGSFQNLKPLKCEPNEVSQILI